MLQFQKKCLKAEFVNFLKLILFFFFIFKKKWKIVYLNVFKLVKLKYNQFLID